MVTSYQSFTLPFVGVDDKTIKMVPFLIISFARSAVNRTPVSPETFNILATIPEVLAALLFFILIIALAFEHGRANNRVNSQVHRIPRELFIQTTLMVLSPSNLLGLVANGEVT